MFILLICLIKCKAQVFCLPTFRQCDEMNVKKLSRVCTVLIYNIRSLLIRYMTHRKSSLNCIVISKNTFLFNILQIDLDLGILE